MLPNRLDLSWHSVSLLFISVNYVAIIRLLINACRRCGTASLGTTYVLSNQNLPIRKTDSSLYSLFLTKVIELFQVVPHHDAHLPLAVKNALQSH